MKNWKGMQAVRLAAMVLAIAGIIYALEFMDRRLAVWFWVGVLCVGFVGLLYTFRIEQRRMRCPAARLPSPAHGADAGFGAKRG